MAFAFTTVVYL